MRATGVNGKKERTYISKENKDFASKLALKTFLLAKVQDIELQLLTIDQQLNQSKKKTSTTSKVWKDILTDSDFCSLLPMEEIASIDELAAWQAAPYERSSEHPETRTIEMQDGTMCRSKSERQIDDELIRYAVPHRYECCMQLGSEIIHPDFIVRNKRTGKIYIWEHFGRMDKENYFNYFIYKMRLYIKNGYIPGVNLIMTFETDTQPLNISEIRNMIELYLI